MINLKHLLLAFIATLFFSDLSFGQRKPNDKYYSTSFTEKQYPLKPLPSDITTYSSKIKGYTKLDKERLRIKYLKMSGLKIDNEAPHITLSVKLPEFGFRTKTEVKQKEYEDSKTKTKYYRYYVVQKYRYSVEYIVYKTKNDEMLAEGTFVDSKEKNFSERRTRKAAYEVYTKAAEGGHNKRLEEVAIKNTLTQVKEAFESDFLVVDKDRGLGLGNVKGDGERLPDMKKAFELAKEGIKALNQESGQKNLQEAIQIWKKALPESDLKKRKARINYRMTRMIYYNMAFAYYLLNDLSNARKYALECKKLKGIRYRADIIIKKSDEKEKRYKVNNIAFK